MSTTRDSSSSPDVTTLDDDMSDEHSLSPEDEDIVGKGSSGEDRTRDGKGGRRRRTAFTSEQLLELEKEFHAKKYLSLTERSQIAHALKLSEIFLNDAEPYIVGSHNAGVASYEVAVY
ncbi:UNVERIFIED_CONTAM: Homeobox protein CHOX-7 [Trichonephila clavipes]